MQTPKTVQQMGDFLRLRKQRQGVKLSHIRARPPHKNGEGRNTLRQKNIADMAVRRAETMQKLRNTENDSVKSR